MHSDLEPVNKHLCSYRYCTHHAQESSVSGMLPKLVQSKHLLISVMLRSKSVKAHEIVEVARCSARSVYAIKWNIRRYGSTKAVPNYGRRPRSSTPLMFSALCERLLENLASVGRNGAFFLGEFNIHVSTLSTGRALRSHGWTKKNICRVAKGRNADL
jgi:hypothetical protein